MIAHYTSGDDNEYFTWKDAQQDTARVLADKFLSRFLKLAELGAGWDYPYAGWYLRLLWGAEAGWLPVFFPTTVTFRASGYCSRTSAQKNGAV